MQTFLTEREVRQRADMARERLGGDVRPVDAQKVAKAHGLKTFFVEFTDKAPEHVSQRVAALHDHDERTIYINKAMGGAEKNHHIAVELGKALLYPLWSASTGYELSYRDADASATEALHAQVFARALLVQPKLIAPVRGVRTYPEIAQMCVIPWTEFQKEIPLIEAARD